jgi:Transposase DDE domain
MSHEYVSNRPVCHLFSVTCFLSAFKAKMETEEAKAIYRQRSQIAEFPHAWIKERCGLRQFRCRGQEKTSMEAIWACLSYNIIRWFSIRYKLNAAAAAAAAA